MRLDGLKAIVTGAASGIGNEIARQFTREGASVALLDVNLKGATLTAAEIGGKAIGCDVTNPESVKQSVTEALTSLGGVDILVNAAGILVRQPFETIDITAWQRLFEINLRGPALVILAALPALRTSAAASVINIASLSALRPSLGTSAYAATKGGLLMMSKCMAEEFAPIRVNCICPGIVDTPMTSGFMAEPETRKLIEQANVLHLTGRPADIAGAAIYLASAESRFMTGTQIVIDGGQSFA